ncbi:hypothetical protein O181_008230 [Austropuccinia psidii MF-1]|uniref:Uncharacterized protein n=1 Tax=Austropuccinia psidii MF-1 TaxID=1389203 RepID=A0A9Q3BNX8_9BASI|nr:hypothetical protein [Austropuccinia psidii MF-1]
MENCRQVIQPRVPIEGICRKYSEDFPQRDILQRTHHRREIEPEITYSDFFRLIRSGNPTKLPSGFTPLRHQQISDQESPYFPIPGRIQARKRIIGQEKDSFNQRKKERPRIRNDIFTQIKHNVVIPESTISSNTLWLQLSQFVEQTQKELERIHENISRLQEVDTLQTKTIHNLQENYTKLGKASEETKRRLNLVSEEENDCKRDRKYLDEDIDKLFRVCQNIKPQTQGHVSGNTPYHQEDIIPNVQLDNKQREPSKYQVGNSTAYLEKEALKQLPEATSWPKFSGVGGYDHMELINYIDGLFIDVESIPHYWITARLNTELKGNASICYTEMKDIHGRRNCHGGGVK